jgi:hypothetical protein
LLTGLVTGTIKLIWDGTSLGVNQFFEIIEAMHLALDSGKTYMIEFLLHLFTHALKLMNEALLFSSLEEYMNKEEDMVHLYKKPLSKSTTTTKKCQHYQLKEEEKKKYHLYGLSTVKVSVNDSIWSVPLFKKKPIQQSNLTVEDVYAYNK